MAPPHILLIGTGSIGTRHAQNLTDLGARVTPLSMRALGVDGILRAIRDARDAQGAVIATATDLRLPLVEACSEAGLPVYIEKPVAFRPDELRRIYDAAAVPERSMIGFMMRYHPALPCLMQIVAEDAVFRFDLEIGHDVTQWRQNWCFADSYAAQPEGGGVLLDLCHEIDIAHALFPGARTALVQSLGHVGFPGVDFATTLTLADDHAAGTVAMDYLSPHFLRRIRLRGLHGVAECDLLTATVTRTRAGTAPETRSFDFERNAMFVSAMRDFLDRIAGRPWAGRSPLPPGMPEAEASCTLIARAWADRQFTGTIAKDMT